MNGGFARGRYKGNYFFTIHTKGDIFKADDGYSLSKAACRNVYDYTTDSCGGEVFEDMKVIIPGEVL